MEELIVDYIIDDFVKLMSDEDEERLLKNSYIQDGYEKGIEQGIKQGIEQGVEYNMLYNVPIGVDTLRRR